MKRPLVDPRLSKAEFRRELERMARESGWAEIGGRLIRDENRNPVSRTVWIPRAEWYQRMQQDPQARIPGGQWAVEKAVALALKGEPMNPQQRRSVLWMLTDFETYAAWREQEEREAAEQFAT